MKEQLILSVQEAESIVFGDTEKFKIILDRITSNSRWSIRHEIVVQRLGDNKFFKSKYSVGATECQDESPYEYCEPIFNEVEEKEKLIKVYE